MMRVLVATDGSTDARTAAQWLADFPLADDASALVLGALKRLLLGSVSERVLRHAACPVLIVRARGAV